jgi:hypothetical protein
LQELIEKEKKEHGLMAVRFFPSANKDVGINELAREAVMMHESYLAGDYIDITNTVM